MVATSVLCYGKVNTSKHDKIVERCCIFINSSRACLELLCCKSIELECGSETPMFCVQLCSQKHTCCWLIHPKSGVVLEVFSVSMHF